MSDELNPVINITPSRNTETDWTFQDAVANGHIRNVQRVKKEADRQEFKSWKVEDQGERGACVGYSVGALLYWHWMKKGFGSRNKPSKRWIWEGAKETDELNGFPTTAIESAGTTIKAALELLRKHGTLTDRELSIRKEKTNLPEATVKERCGVRKISAYYHLREIDEIRRWISSQGPVVIWIRPDDGFMGVNRRDWKLTDYWYPGSVQGHAFLLVAYDKDGFMARNSWGRSWGKSGHAHLSDAYLERAKEECYGIVV